MLEVPRSGLADQVAVGVVHDVVGADGHRTVRACRSRAGIGEGVVVGGVGLDRALELVALVLPRDVVDGVVGLVVAVGGDLVGIGLVLPGRGGHPVELVVGVVLGPGAADGIAEPGAGEVAGLDGLVLELREVADRVVAEGEVVEGVAVGEARLDRGDAPGLVVVGVGGAGAVAEVDEQALAELVVVDARGVDVAGVAVGAAHQPHQSAGVVA